MSGRKLNAGAVSIIALVVILVLLIILVWSPWDMLRFHGDGKFSKGFLFRPRYVVTFPEIILNQNGEHHFRFHGLPKEEMTLILYVKDRQVDTDARRVPLENLQVTIEAILTDEKGEVGCHASGRPAPGNRDGIWVLMSGGKAGYWHWRCNPVQVFSDRTYDLTIRVFDVGPQVDKVVVTPTLQGGGIELP